MAKRDSVMDGSAGMSPRKAMASGMGEGGGKFGCESIEQVQRCGATHPDRSAMTGAKGAMADNSRGIGSAVSHGKNHHPAQAAPDHGPNHPGGHGRSAY